jgi:hypothetical protein
MLLKFATLRIFARFSTAPPHSAAPVASVRAARPIEVLGFTELMVAVSAQFLVGVHAFS